MEIKVVAFDCFGTVFNMSGVSREEIASYVEHVRNNDFSPFTFPPGWWNLKAHPDAEHGIKALQDAGFICIAASNGSPELITQVSMANHIHWHAIVDFAAARSYKPNAAAYVEIVRVADVAPSTILMVTANPTFGDIEGAALVGMQSQVIRRDSTPQTIVELANRLINSASDQQRK